MQLYEIQQNGNKYCGPSAISAIAGIGTKEAAAILREGNGKEAIKGTYMRDMVGALRKLGFNCTLTGTYPKGKRVNLRQWAKDHARGDDVHLVAAGNHWILVQGRYAICGRTKNLVAVADHPNVRAFVTESISITKQRDVDPATVIPQKKPSIAGARLRAYALARKHKIEIEPGPDRDSSICVWQARGHHDPYMDGHYFGDWHDVLKRVEEYADLQIRASTTEVQSEVAAKANSNELARQHGIRLEQEADGDDRAKWVTPPDSIKGTAADPYSHHRVNGNWQEVLARVQAYVTLITGKPVAPAEEAPSRRVSASYLDNWPAVLMDPEEAAEIATHDSSAAAAGVANAETRKPIGESEARAMARELAAEHGIDVEQDDHGARTIWIHPPENFDDELDEFVDSHFVDTWREALERVEYYICLLSTEQVPEPA